MRFEEIDYGGRMLIHTDEGVVLVSRTGWDSEYVEAELLDVAGLNALRREQMGNREWQRHRRNFPLKFVHSGIELSAFNKLLSETYVKALEQDMKEAINRQVFGKWVDW